jgi:S-adenosylmethionine:tRNA-ribosyltransferase-isomerase (queuine synthetase)
VYNALQKREQKTLAFKKREWYHKQQCRLLIIQKRKKEHEHTVFWRVPQRLQGAGFFRVAGRKKGGN